MKETGVRSLGGEDLLEKEMATHSSILAQKIPWTEEPVRLYGPWGWTRLSDFTFTFHLEPSAYFEQGWTQLAYISICSVGEGIPVSFQGPREISALGTSEIRSQKDFIFPTPSIYHTSVSMTSPSPEWSLELSCLLSAVVLFLRGKLAKRG